MSFLPVINREAEAIQACCKPVGIKRAPWKVVKVEPENSFKTHHVMFATEL